MYRRVGCKKLKCALDTWQQSHSLDLIGSEVLGLVAEFVWLVEQIGCQKAVKGTELCQFCQDSDTACTIGILF